MIKKINEFLDQEKDIYNYLKKAKRTYGLIRKLSVRKKEYAKEINELLKELEEMSHVKFLQKVLKKNKRRKSVDIILKRIRSNINKIQIQAKRQTGLLLQDINISWEANCSEGTVLEDIKAIPLFNALNNNELEVLNQIIHKEKPMILNIFNTLRKITVTIKEQETKYFESFFSYLDVKKFNFRNMWFLIGENKEFIRLCDEELDRLNYCNEITKKIEEISRFIIEENKKVLRIFNEKDIEQVQKTIGEEYMKSFQRASLIEHFLSQQRKLRSNINPKQLVAVHTTDYFPEKGIIRPTGHHLHKKISVEIPAQRTKMGVIPGIKVGLDFHLPRETIHFALNGLVGSHMYGNFDGRKYTILVPFEKMIDNVIYINPQDTWTFGALVLPKGVDIIVDEKDPILKRYSRKAGNAQIIIKPHKEDSKGFVRRRIKERGYTPMNVGMWSWGSVDIEDKGERERIELEIKDIWSGGWAQEGFVSFVSELNKSIGNHDGTVLERIESEFYLSEIDNKDQFDILDRIAYKGNQEYLALFGNYKKMIAELNNELSVLRNNGRFRCKSQEESYKRLMNAFNSFAEISRKFKRWMKEVEEKGAEWDMKSQKFVPKRTSVIKSGF